MNRPARLIAPLLVAAACIGLWLAVDRATPEPAPGEATYTGTGRLVGGTPPEIARKNLIVLLLDTVRRDAVALGDERPRQMPVLSDLGARGVAFRQAASPAPWTIPTVASVFTGLHPSEHGCQSDGPAPKLLESVVTYAEALSHSFGYETAAFSEVPWYRGASWSVLQGFEGGSSERGYEVRGTKPRQSGFWLHGSDEILDPWVETRDPGRPFFLFLHAYDAHDPYGAENHPPATLPFFLDARVRREAIEAVGSTYALEPWEVLRLVLTNHAGRHALFKQRGPEISKIAARYAYLGYREAPRPTLAAELERAYRAGCRWTDEGLGELLPYLEARGLLEDTLLVVFSDHGEAFGAHGLIGHGRQLDEELIHVPLVMHGPGPFATPRVVDASVGLIDILPTFFDWIGAPDLPGSRGRSLLPLLRGETGGRPVVAEATVTPEIAGQEERRLLQAVRTARWKYVVEYDIQRGHIDERLFDLATDPGEGDDLLVGDAVLADFEIDEAFCAVVELARDRIWEAASSITARAMTPYSAGVPTTDQPRPAPCDASARAGD